jgi:D-alanine-D-alanine ligase-like ATP-grasp enzyme
VTSPRPSYDPTSTPALHEAVTAAHQRLAGAAVCLLARNDMTPIEAAELDGFRDTLTRCAAAVTWVHFDDVRELYLPPAVQLLTGADVVVKFTHGPFNRTGLLPAVLDSLGVRRAGHPSSTDLLSQRKTLVKQLMLRDAVPTLPYVLTTGGTRIGDRLEPLQAGAATTLVVKPDDGNASEGIHWVPSAAEAARVIQAAQGPLLVEPYTPGRIVTVGAVTLLGRTYTLAPLEYLLDDRPVMDAAWKKDPRRAPAGLEPAAEAEVRGYAATVHRAVAADGLSRTDFILGAGGEVTALEINTNVGLGPRHDLAQAFAATGLTYDDLVVCQTAGKLPQPGQ